MRVSIISRNDNSALVQWRDEDGLHRVTLPNEAVADDIPIETLEQGAPYGALWETLGSGATSAIVARALREAGVWTESDLRANVKRARAAALGIANEIVAALLRETREV